MPLSKGTYRTHYCCTHPDNPYCASLTNEETKGLSRDEIHEVLKWRSREYRRIEQLPDVAEFRKKQAKKRLSRLAANDRLYRFVRDAGHIAHLEPFQKSVEAYRATKATE